MVVLSNIKFLILIMSGVLLIVTTVLFVFDTLRYFLSWIFTRHHLLIYQIRNALFHLLVAGGCLCIWLSIAQHEQLLTNFLALSNPETTSAVQRPKFKKEKIKPLTPKMQFKAQRAQLESVGTLDIPDVNLKLPIFNSLTNVELARGACVMEPGMKMGHGNYALAGHYLTQDGALFSPIAKIKKGDRIYIKSEHYQYVYRAYLNKKIPPTDTHVVKQTKKKIVTLITCADGGSNRYLIRGKLIKKSKL